MAELGNLVVERHDQIELLQCFISGDVKSGLIMLHGVNSGKSTTIQRYFQLVKISPIIVDCSLVLSMKDLYGLILGGMGQENVVCHSVNSLMAHLESASKVFEGHMFILLESVEALEEFTDVSQFILGLQRMLSSSQGLCKFSIILCLNVFNLQACYPSVSTSSIPTIFFQNYDRDQIFRILTVSETSQKLIKRCFGGNQLEIGESQPSIEEDHPSMSKYQPGITKEATKFWHDYVNLVLDTFYSYGGCDTNFYIEVIVKLWPKFSPDSHSFRSFLDIYKKNLPYLKSESLLRDSLVQKESGKTLYSVVKDETFGLPAYSKLILCGSYLASHIAPKHDYAVFSRAKGLTRRKSVKKPSSLKLQNAIGFSLERLVAILFTINESLVKPQPLALDTEFYAQIANLLSFGLLVKTLGHSANESVDILDQAKLRANFSYDFAYEVGKSLGVDVGEFLG